MPILELTNLTLRYPGTEIPAVRDLKLGIEQGEIHALIGESGCGKSSTIRMIAGLELPTDGEIRYRGETLNSPGVFVPTEDRKIGMVFQDNALFPHLTVAQNIMFGLKGKERKDSPKLDRLLELTGLAGLGRRYPHEISGGQMQRVALARALAPQPELILMDEPFNNLDIRIKRALLQEISGILKETGTTCLFITHEKSEAFVMADRISVMRNGTLLQSAEPEDIYNAPASTYVAEFFGRANHIRVEWENGVFQSPLGEFPLPPGCASEDAAHGGFLIHRPWDVSFSEDGSIPVVVEESFFFGEYQELSVRVKDSPSEERYKLFTHISRQFEKGGDYRIEIPEKRLVFCRE